MLNVPIYLNSSTFLARLVLVLLLIIGSYPPSVIAGLHFMPMFEVAALFYWTIYNPKVLPLQMLIFIGILQDLLSGQVIGVSLVTLLVSFYIISSQRKLLMSAPFNMIWLGFVIFALIAFVIKWFIVMIVAQQMFFTNIMFTTYFSTCCIYPLLHMLFYYTRPSI